MKFVIVLLLAFIAAVLTAPTQIESNNVGDVVSVNVDANIDLKNEMDINKYTLDVLFKNIQKILIGQNSDDNRFPNLPNLPL
ncbi:hypothetical protein PVAND_013061 [Polypedilum vanderplanki]|uniref:Secreted protein n=1 Tax=Polypedilum vanderplanki TaxID=319348 RepID=A0A9J6CP87_POLVA|nr:hypothetical protein PVAND_013061 [Polypedilum vanderplanki]